jgi:uncharacterized LabA/DUF88 family protein
LRLGVFQLFVFVQGIFIMTDTNEHSAPKVGLYIDIANISLNGGRGMRFDVLRDFACRGGGQAIRLNAYSSFDFKRAEGDEAYREGRHRLHWTLRERGFKVIEKPVKWYQSEDGPVSKANIDLDLAVDALLQSDKLDRVVLATGDGDFVQVVRALQNKGCRVEVVAFNNVSGDLKREADLFISGYLVPNLLPIMGARPEEWAIPNGFARGLCYEFKADRGFGFIRYLREMTTDLWNTDTRQSKSPYASLFVHKAQLPANVKLDWLPSRSMVFEFKIVANQQTNDQQAKLEALDVRWINADASGGGSGTMADE